MNFKAILSGRLEFGNSRSCEKAMQLFQNRYEIIYKGDVFLKMEDVFNPESEGLELFRYSTQVGEKTWNNTVSLLEEAAQFAIAGKLDAWLTDKGQVLYARSIEPKTEKAAVQAFIQGCSLISHSGREQEAIQSLSHAIEKYERHAAAYERRGYVNYRLGNLQDAMYDYSKSIQINPGAAEAYLGRAVVHIAQDKRETALVDLEKALQFAVPLQSVYWIARRIKGDCHLHLEQYEAAVTEYQFFLKRQFRQEDVNYRSRRRAAFRMGKALLFLRKNKEAAQALEMALQIDSDDPLVSEVEIQSWLQESLKRNPSRTIAAVV
jgi:tetratricopeptide (TPR) repeat protein